MLSFGPGKYLDDSARVAKRFRKAGYDALRRLGFLIRGVAQRSIEREPGPSAPGDPPHTHGGQLPRSILYSTERDPARVLIGPSVNVVGSVGKVLEEGGERKGDHYQPRPFMAPALGAEIGQLPGLLAEQYAKV